MDFIMSQLNFAFFVAPDI